MAPHRRPQHRPSVQTFEDLRAHPSLGQGESYSIKFRECCLDMAATGLLADQRIRNLQTAHIFPSVRTIRRWRRRIVDFGNYRIFRRTGNNFATVLRGRDLFFVAFYRVLYPTATAAEINAFLFTAIHANDPFPRFYHPSQITRAEDRLGFSRKRGSTTARQALLAINIAKREIYWFEDYPAGVADIQLEDLIDIDEAGIFLETAARRIGKVSIGSRVREEGPYGHSTKYTLTMAISGDRNGQRWVLFEEKVGTTSHDFF